MPAAGQCLGQARPVEQFLAAVEAIAVDHHRVRPGARGLGCRARAWCRQRAESRPARGSMRPSCVDRRRLREPAHRWPRARPNPGPACARPPAGTEPRAPACRRRRTPRPRASSSSARPISRSAIRHPLRHELRRAGIRAPGRGVADGLAHVDDLADLRAALQRHGDGKIPDVVGKIFEQRHGYQTGAG